MAHHNILQCAGAFNLCGPPSIDAWNRITKPLLSIFDLMSILRALELFHVRGPPSIDAWKSEC
ncbi:4859_t:CDS:2 [Funneliformis mosseae]|uniref:4859_t:CDS:1 n=1 Tax=Funneliformis mosseae TaxID=27381 RepID=A0A9N8Z2T8_FUNMO|nr:4859_t:CDS:2 [Funneliformis mosseae]